MVRMETPIPVEAKCIHTRLCGDSHRIAFGIDKMNKTALLEEMCFLVGVLYIIVGIVSIKNPYGVYELTQKWKSRGDAEPSDDYIQRCKVGGVIRIVTGVLVMALAYIFEYC